MQLKKFEKMSKAELVVFCLMAISSGTVIAIGGVSSLLANAIYGVLGKLIGGVLFTLGIYAIIVYEMRLFTGMVSNIPTLGVKNCWRLGVCFIGNIIGVAIVALLAYYSPVAETVVAQGHAVAVAKLSTESWAIKAFCSSVLCGMLITLSVQVVNFAPQKGISATLGVLFPIMVFAFCGFDHSVANMLYFYYYGTISWQMIGYILITIVGNVVGGVLLPYITLLKTRVHQQKEEKGER